MSRDQHRRVLDPQVALDGRLDHVTELSAQGDGQEQAAELRQRPRGQLAPQQQRHQTPGEAAEEAGHRLGRADRRRQPPPAPAPAAQVGGRVRQPDAGEEGDHHPGRLRPQPRRQQQRRGPEHGHVQQAPEGDHGVGEESLHPPAQGRGQGQDHAAHHHQGQPAVGAAHLQVEAPGQGQGHAGADRRPVPGRRAMCSSSQVPRPTTRTTRANSAQPPAQRAASTAGTKTQADRVRRARERSSGFTDHTPKRRCRCWKARIAS